MNAWWSPGSHDSLELLLASVDATWEARLLRTGDSLYGITTFSFNDSDGPPFPVLGKRIPCPRASGA